MSDAWRHLDRYMIVSADTHAGADLYDYKLFLPTRWHDEFDAWANAYESPFDDLVHATAHRNWDSDFRITEMDADGVAAELLFPNTIPPFFPTTMLIVVGLPKERAEFERRWAGVQAHNRWTLDFVGRAPERRRGLVQILPNDVDVAMDEVRWAKETGRFGGALLVPVPPGHPVPPFFHTRYEPLWALCADLDFPVVLHNGTTPDIPMDQPLSATMTLLRASMSSESMCADMVLSGVFERHPNLKFVPTESGLWAMAQAKSLDLRVIAMRRSASNRTMTVFGNDVIDSLSMLPSDYVRRQVYYGFSGPAALRSTLELRDEVGTDHLMYGTDYPHEEGSSPQTTLMLRWLFSDMPEADLRDILAGTAAKLFGFDLDALVPVAERVGPAVAEIHRPLTAEELVQSDNTIADFVDRPFPGGALLGRGRATGSGF